MEKIYRCGLCKKQIDWDEYCVNFGICNVCFDADYFEYYESHAGPFDWIAEGLNG